MIALPKYRKVTYWIYTGMQWWEIITKGKISFFRFQRNATSAVPVKYSSLASKLLLLQPGIQYKFVQEYNSISTKIVEAMTSGAECCNQTISLCKSTRNTLSVGQWKKFPNLSSSPLCRVQKMACFDQFSWEKATLISNSNTPRWLKLGKKTPMGPWWPTGTI